MYLHSTALHTQPTPLCFTFSALHQSAVTTADMEPPYSVLGPGHQHCLCLTHSTLHRSVSTTSDMRLHTLCVQCRLGPGHQHRLCITLPGICCTTWRAQTSAPTTPAPPPATRGPPAHLLRQQRLWQPPAFAPHGQRCVQAFTSMDVLYA